ncbi:MAG: hypothetical protein SFY69_00830 [Planctomycetota bacterium]|nr:hypothetical protein [Planctomycetota bacterium]
MRRLRTLALLLACLFPAICRAQPSEPGPAELLRNMILALREAPRAHELVVRAYTPEGRERVSRVELLTDRGGDARPRRVVLRLGRSLHVEASGGVLRAVSPRNPDAYFEAPVADPLTPASIAAVLPDLPLPLIEWAIGETPAPEARGAEPSGADAPVEVAVPPLGIVTFERAARSEPPGTITLHGRTPAGPVELTLDAQTGRLRHVVGMLRERSLALEIGVRETSADGAWGITIGSRTRVASLSALRPAPAELSPGAKAVGLGLMASDLTPWGVVDALHALGANPVEAGEGPLLAALVLYKVDAPGMEDGALAAVTALQNVKRSLDKRRLAGEARVPRLLVRPVGVFALDQFRPEEARLLASRWEGIGLDVAWSSAGQALLDRFERGAPGVVVLIDEEQTLRGAASIGPGALAADAAADEVKAAIDDMTPSR